MIKLNKITSIHVSHIFFNKHDFNNLNGNKYNEIFSGYDSKIIKYQNHYYYNASQAECELHNFFKKYYMQ